jgi:nucleoside-diphosphate-sugar epimerase
MKVLVTGHAGYIGAVAVPLFEQAGHEVVGLDTQFFDGCALGQIAPARSVLRLDLRDIEPRHLEGFQAVVHLAALSNDPLSDLNPQCTYDINHHASVRLAEMARAAGVERFVFSSSCSNYGAGGDGFLDEKAALNPVTPYGESKVFVERDVSALATDRFSPTFLRNATAFGFSPMLRADIVVNNLVGYAMLTGEVLIKSDGSPWRPLVHVEDISRAFLAVIEAPRERIHNEVFNVGLTSENYTVRQVGEMVEAAVPGSKVVFAGGASPDKRNYRVDCSKIARELPSFQPRWTVAEGIAELREAYRANGLTKEEFLGSKYLRILRIRELLATGRLASDLRWVR